MYILGCFIIANFAKYYYGRQVKEYDMCRTCINELISLKFQSGNQSEEIICDTQTCIRLDKKQDIRKEFVMVQ